MTRFFFMFLVGIIVSCYYYSFSFTFLPEKINTKMMLAVIGAFLMIYNLCRVQTITISKDFLGAIGLAVAFSFVCFVSTDYNNTNDYVYATYFVSFSVWLLGAYTVCVAIRKLHGRVSLRLLTYYLTGVSTAQCLLAILIDRMPAVRFGIDRYIYQGQDFLLEINRLYGIGASLDSAGVRFSVVLVMIAVVLYQDRLVRLRTRHMLVLIGCYFVISLIGNMVARTTSVGMILGFAYMFLATGILRLVIRLDYIKLQFVFGGVLLLVGAVSVFLYHQDPVFYQNIRFAFEGFFNWMETGEWFTGSTDKLNREMWVWPTDTSTWLIGTGLFDNFVFSTDIGYCRFILYCGISGILIFSLFFIYNAFVFVRRFPAYKSLFLLLLLLGFVVWFKVSTDIFFIYALFYSMDKVCVDDWCD
jgi:hypothetical protein